MTKIIDNLVTTGLSGKLGKQIVFRQWGKTTFVAKAPVLDQRYVESELRIAQRLRFKEATAYAKKVMNDVELKQAYHAKCKARQNAFSLAVKDFFSAPAMGEIDLSNYTGETDSFIRVYATDDFHVKQVQVRIEDENGVAIESGYAEQEGTTEWWRYIVTTTNLLPGGGKVVASACDLPGNTTTAEMTI